MVVCTGWPNVKMMGMTSAMHAKKLAALNTIVRLRTSAG
jgi:hypothetical protein